MFEIITTVATEERTNKTGAVENWAQYYKEDSKGVEKLVWTKILPPSDLDMEWAELLGLLIEYDGVQGVKVTDSESFNVYEGTRHNLSSGLSFYAAALALATQEVFIERPSRAPKSKTAKVQAENRELKDIMAQVLAGDLDPSELAKYV